MPTANWLTPQPASYSEEPEPRGLLSFLGGGPDLGAEISDRGGVIAQILMNLGGNRGGAGIAEATANVNERSEARRERRKAERMVNRAADKIEGSNPEMAAAMRANTAFGMQMLGKQYESEWTSKARMAELEREQELLGKRELALQDAKANAWKSDPLFSGILERMQGGGGTAPAPAAAPEPASGDLGGIPAPTGLSAGTGTEPAPSNLPIPGNIDTAGQPLSADASLQQPAPTQAPAPAGPQPSSFDPASVPVEPFPWSDDPQVRMLQESFSPLVGAPRISAAAASAIWRAAPAGGVDLATAIKNAGDEWTAQKNRTQDAARKDFEYQRGLTDEASKTARANLVSQQEPTRLQNEYEATVPPQPLVGSPEQIQKLEVLAKEGYSKQDTDLMGGVDRLYNQVISGVRGGPDARASQVAGTADDIRTAQAAKTVADTAAQAGGGVAGASKAMADSIRAIPEAQRTPEDTQDLAILDAAAAVAPVKPDVAGQMLGNLSTERRQRLDTMSQIAERKRSGDTAASAEARQVKAAKDVEDKAAKAEKDTFIRGVDNAKVVQKTVKKIGNIMYGGGGETASYDEGGKGWITGQIPGTARRAIDGLITTIDSQRANGELQAIRSASVGGASGYGALQEKELELLQTQLNNLKIAAETGENLEQALKEVWNHYESMIHPTSGKRMDEDVPGFKMRDFDFEQDSPGLYEWALREGKLGDFVREDRAQFGNEDPLGLGSKPKGGVDPNDPLGLGAKPGRP